MTKLKSQLEEIAEMFQKAGFTTWLREDTPSLMITTKMEYPYPDSPDIARAHNPTYLRMHSEMWIAFSPVGQLEAIVSLSKDCKSVAQTLIDFYHMGENTREKLYSISETMYLLQEKDFIATVANASQINIGVVPNFESRDHYFHMIEAAKSGNSHVKYRIIKNTTSWSLTTESANDTLSFKSPVDAAHFILDQLNV
jgi:hypothetical protein